MILSKHTMFIGLVGLCTMLTAFKCEDESDEKVVSNVSEASLCAEMAEISCHNAFQCCTGDQLEAVFGIKITNTEAECRRDMELLCERENSAFLFSLKKKRVTLNKDKIDACFDQYVAPADVCTPVITDFAPACETDLYTGKQSAGQDCLFDFDCVKGAYCAGYLKCADYAKKGEECDPERCTDDLFCEENATTGETTCQERKAEGKECNNNIECQENLLCFPYEENNGSPYTGTCEPRKELGATCTNDYECKSAFCLPSMCEDGVTKCYDDGDCGSLQCIGTSVCAEKYDTLQYCSTELVSIFEVGGEGPTDACTGNEFECGSGECIPLFHACDGTVDCSDGSDEAEALCGASGCGTLEWACANGECIQADYLCDGDADCTDGSDELVSLCSTMPCDSSAEWRCANAVCIPQSYLCDGDDDCGDGSDELAIICENL